MRRTIVWIIIVSVMASLPLPATAAPPSRPLNVTSTQFDELQRLESAPEHSAVLEVHASYKTDHEKQIDMTRRADDVASGVMVIGYPTLIMILLIAAAPL